MHKPIRIATMWALAAAVAVGQSAPAKSSGKTAPASTAAAKPMAPAAVKPKAPAAKPAAKVAAKPAPKPTPKVAKGKAPAATVTAKKAAPASKGKRDPFVNPIKQDAANADVKCSSGSKCLIVAQLVLKGTVKTKDGMIAMVVNGAKKEFNLRENDQVLNAVVLKITGDSIVFRETVHDLLGNASTKDVVKRVTVPAI